MSTAKNVKLGEIADLNPQLPLEPASTSIVDFVPMSAVSAETADVIGMEERQYSAVKKGYTPFVDGDVLVAKITPCFENRKIAQATLPHGVGFGSTEFHVLRLHRDVADPRYVLHFLRQDRVRREGERKMTGSAGQRRVPEHFFTALEIPLPSLSEQRRIVGVLDRAEVLRAGRRTGLARWEVLTKSIFVEMFGDPIHNTRRWTVENLGNIGELDRGISKHRPRNAPELLGGPYPLVQTGEVANCDGYVRSYTATYSETGLQQSKIWPAGTLCITIAANIAKAGILTFDACFPDSVVGFRADEPATVEFVRVWLSFLQKSLEDAAPESAQKNINLAILRSLRIPVPPLERQREFAQRVAAVERMKAAQRASLAELDALFASLQHRAFRGEL